MARNEGRLNQSFKLNPMGRGCLDFLMKWDVPPSHPVLTFGTEDVSRCPDRDAGMLAGWPCPDT